MFMAMNAPRVGLLLKWKIAIYLFQGVRVVHWARERGNSYDGVLHSGLSTSAQCADCTVSFAFD